MKELLLYIARSLVQHPDQVTVTEVETGDELTLELRVAPEDMGRVIGRQGRIAKEIRTAPVLHDRVVDAPDMPAAVKDILGIH